MSSPLPPIEVSLNDRVAAVATVLCDGRILVMDRDPFFAVLPATAPDKQHVMLRCFTFDAAETTIVEISVPIASRVPSTADIDAWAVQQGHELYNVYVVREETNSVETGSVLKAQSSIIATNLSVPVLGLAVDILTETAPLLASEFHKRFGPTAASQIDGVTSQPPEPAERMQGAAELGASNVRRQVTSMPGYL